MRWLAGKNPFLRHPRICLVLFGLLAVPMLLRLGQLEIRPDARVLLEGDQRSQAAFEKVDTILNRETVLVLSMTGHEVFTRQGLTDLRELCHRLYRIPGLLDVKSLTHSVKPVRQGFSFAMVPFVPEGELTDSEIARIREFCLTHPLVRNVMVSAEGNHLLITATFSRDLTTASLRRAFRSEVDTALAAFEARGYRFRTLAMPLAEEEIDRALRGDLVRGGAIAGLGTVALLWLAFRSLRITGLILVNLTVALVGFAGLLQVLGIALTLYTIMLLPLVGGVHLTLMAHQFIAYQRALRPGKPHETAMLDLVKRVFKPSAFAALTTGIGLLSLGMCDVPEVRRFGFAGAVGVVWTFAWAFGPGLSLQQLGLRAFTQRPLRLSAAGNPLHVLWLSYWAVTHRQQVFAMAAISLVLAIVGARAVRTDIRVVEFLDRANPTRQALEEMDRVYGGINVVQIELNTGRTNGVNDLTFLRYLENISAEAQREPGITGVYSYPQLLAMMNQIWEQERPGSLRLPDTPLLMNLFSSALKARNYPFLTALVDDSFQTAHLVVRSRDMPSGDYLKTIERIARLAREQAPPGVTVSAAQGLHSILEADRRILRAQSDSALLTLGVVGLVLALLWRSAWLAGLTLLANVIPVGLVLGVASLADIPLNSVTVMIAAIVLSIAVDDSVHLVTWWREERRAGQSPRGALDSALQAKAPPIVLTSLVLIVVFGSFLAFSFPPIRHFGLLSALAFVGALGSVLTFLPAALPGRSGEPATQGDVTPPGIGRILPK